MSIESEAAEEVVSALLGGADKAMQLTGNEVLAQIDKAIKTPQKIEQEKPSVRKKLNEIKKSRQQRASTQIHATQKTTQPKVRNTR